MPRLGPCPPASTASSGPFSARPTPARPTWRSSGCAPTRRASSASRCACSPARSMTASSQMKGANQVALITGEERIVPQGARYYPVHRRKHAGQASEGDGRPRLRLRRDRRGAARHRPGARPCLHRPDAPRPRPRGDADPRLRHAEAADPRSCCPKPRSSAARASRPCAMPARPSCRACRREARSSPSPPSRSTRWPRCCAASRAARRW